MLNSAAIKRLPRFQGIYQLLNIKSGRRYIGATQNILCRMARHIKALETNSHPNSFLQFDYVREDFTLAVLEVVATTEGLGNAERRYLSLWPPRALYNHPAAPRYEQTLERNRKARANRLAEKATQSAKNTEQRKTK